MWTSPESTDLFARTLAQTTFQSTLLSLGAAYLAGLAACTTPCVYPMIGITVSIFGAKQARSRSEAVQVSAAFVLGIAALYTPLGLLVALSNVVWGRALSSPWLSVALTILFVTMASSMFGAFELSLPSSWQARLSQVGGSGRRGAFLMGVVSGLIASPCTTAPFASILGSFAQVGVAVGTTSVLLFALGLGTPFFVVGAFAARLPKPGAWMRHAKSGFGVVLLVLALHYARGVAPALRSVAQPGRLFGILAAAAMGLGLVLGAIHVHPEAGSRPRVWVRKVLGVTLATVGAFALLSWLQLAPGRTAFAVAGLTWSTDEQTARAQASSSRRPLLLDFTADWCTACHEMEREVFADPRFVRAADRFVALRLDGSDEDAPQFKANTEHYAIKGLPALVLLDSRGEVATVFRKKVGLDELVAAMEAVR